MSTEVIKNFLDLDWQDLDHIKEDIRVRGREKSLRQLSEALPADYMEDFIGNLLVSRPDAIISPVKPVPSELILKPVPEHLADLSIENNLVDFALYGNEGVESGIGWGFTQPFPTVIEYTGVRVMSLPDHIIVLGQKKGIHIDLGRMTSSRSTATVRTALQHAVLNFPGQFRLQEQKVNPKVRV